MERQQLLDQLAAELMAIGGANPLTNFEVSSFGQIDLARAHPGGLAQLTGSRSSTISNLVRDGVAQARALSAARRIRNKAKSIERSFSMSAMFIAAGAVVTSQDKTLPIELNKYCYHSIQDYQPSSTAKHSKSHLLCNSAMIHSVAPVD